MEVALHPESFARQVLEKTGRLGLQPNECFVLNFGWAINSPDLAQRRETARLFPGLCRFAAAAHFASILLIPGPVHSELGPEKSLDLSVAALGDLAEIAADHGLRLHMEADVDSCANTPELADDLCRRTKNLFLTLDYSHFICQGIDPARVERLHPHTRHLHIRQATPGRLVAPADAETIDFGRVLSQLEASGYRGLYCIEYLNDEPEARTVAMVERLSLATAANAAPARFFGSNDI
jgi:sugar phosphate isomerase/epimerase